MAIVTNADQENFLAKLQNAAEHPDAAKDNITTTDPTVNDDSDDGYSVNSIWHNTVSGLFYFCTDATPGAAVWVVMGGGAGATVSGDIVYATGFSFRDVPMISGELVSGEYYFTMNLNSGDFQQMNMPDASGTLDIVNLRRGSFAVAVNHNANAHDLTLPGGHFMGVDGETSQIVPIKAGTSNRTLINFTYTGTKLFISVSIPPSIITAKGFGYEGEFAIESGSSPNMNFDNSDMQFYGMATTAETITFSNPNARKGTFQLRVQHHASASVLTFPTCHYIGTTGTSAYAKSLAAGNTLFTIFNIQDLGSAGFWISDAHFGA